MVNKEKRITNKLTGGAKGQKDIQLSVIPPEALMELGRVYGYGTKKYARHNFRKGYDWSLSYDALLRHLFADLNGEDRDPESGLYHLSHATWHCLNLLQYHLDKEAGRQPKELDDRWRS